MTKVRLCHDSRSRTKNSLVIIQKLIFIGIWFFRSKKPLCFRRETFVPLPEQMSNQFLDDLQKISKLVMQWCIDRTKYLGNGYVIFIRLESQWITRWYKSEINRFVSFFLPLNLLFFWLIELRILLCRLPIIRKLKF